MEKGIRWYAGFMDLHLCNFYYTNVGNNFYFALQNKTETFVKKKLMVKKFKLFNIYANEQTFY
jgi:hypothetical protein